MITALMSRMLHMEDYMEQVPFSLLLYRWESDNNDFIKWWQWWCQWWWWWWCWWGGQPSGLRRMAALLLWLISRLTDGKLNLGVDELPTMKIMIMIIFMTSSWSLWIMYNLDYMDICVSGLNVDVSQIRSKCLEVFQMLSSYIVFALIEN